MGHPSEDLSQYLIYCSHNLLGISPSSIRYENMRYVWWKHCVISRGLQNRHSLSSPLVDKAFVRYEELCRFSSYIAPPSSP